MRIYAVVLFIFFFSSTFAKEPSSLSDDKSLLIINGLIEDMIGSATTVDTTCADCVEQIQKLPSLTSSFYDNGADCSKFIKTDGSYGPWGKIIEQYILTNDKGYILLKDDLEALQPRNLVCSNWYNMNEKQRVHFWVWTMASISWKESTCFPDRNNLKGTDGVAVGLFQMNELKRDRYWRGENCQAHDISPPSDNIRCALDIMSELMLAKEGEYHSNGKLYGSGSNSYWEQLRNNRYGDQIGHRIRQFPLCKR